MSWGLLFTHQQPLGDSGRARFSQTTRQRVLGWSVKVVSLLLQQPVTPTISNHFGWSDHLQETRREQPGAQPAHAVPPNVPGDTSLSETASPPPHTEERAAGGRVPLCRWVSFII